MNHLEKTLQELAAKSGTANQRHALIGLDGFVDRIMHVVDQRHGQGDAFDAMPTIDHFGTKVSAAAGKSANFELFPVVDKLGGNGPLMANAVLATGVATRYIGALGKPLHPVLADFARRTNAVSLCDPGITIALEFTDGKLMLGTMASLDEISYNAMVNAMGEGALFDAFSRAQLVALVNWTMIPNMTALLEDLLSRLLPNLPPMESGRTFFFDLADPAKRSASDLRAVLRTISRFRSYGAVTLGLNYAEACQVASVLDLPPFDNNGAALQQAATAIRASLDLSCLVIHPREGAAAATRDGAWYVDGPFCAKPKISTGAGDHFNGGFAVAQTIGLSPVAALTVAVATSGQYVRTAKSPSLQDTARFIENWKNGSLPA
jgi:hypothetical protein